MLDIFTELEATLEAELSLRKKQYEYYRNSLLSFDDMGAHPLKKYLEELCPQGVPMVAFKTLEEVALDFGRGKSKHRPRNDERLYGGDIPFIQTGDIRNSGHYLRNYSQTYSEFGLAQSKLWKKGTLCITIAANISETAILDFDACFPDSVIGFVANPRETSEPYVEYLLSAFKTKVQEKSYGSAQENINLSLFHSLKFPFPPLEIQQMIVDILDKFDKLVNDLTTGLPAEINARRQQYEYYRNKLLTFKECKNDFNV
ncbi:restriction endonuclease subunit S [Pasteurella caecimuris]|nr:restriction endonuclease subunit S [Pasteurella caecimuris]MCR1838389.1 restriction endonuclease subunit S [Pasteurella caecimuris]MCU0107585.1 restriction endonuclease subunit S [Pasteurella caecimuris]